MGAPRDPHRIQARTEIEIHSPASKKGTTAARLIDVMPAAPAAAQETEQRGFPNTIVQRSFSQPGAYPASSLHAPRVSVSVSVASSAGGLGVRDCQSSVSAGSQGSPRPSGPSRRCAPGQYFSRASPRRANELSSRQLARTQRQWR